MITIEKTRAVINALIKLREMATDEQALEAADLYPSWKEGQNYNAGERVMHEGILYKVLTDHVSQTDWTPSLAVSLFTKILIPNDNLIYDWEQPESTNPYMKDDKVLYNDALWISIIDNNVWEPGVYGWEKIEE